MTALSPQSALAQSAIETRSHTTERLHMAERANTALLRIHSLDERPGAAAPFADWPCRTGASLGDDPAVLCLRPREWLVLSERLAPEALYQRFASGVAPGATAVFEQSDGLALFHLSGPAAPWLLAKLSGLDFLAGADGRPHCARTRIGQIAAVVHYRGPRRRDFELIADRSVARYLWELLIDAAPHATELSLSGWGAAGDAE